MVANAHFTCLWAKYNWLQFYAVAHLADSDDGKCDILKSSKRDCSYVPWSKIVDHVTTLSSLYAKFSRSFLDGLTTLLPSGRSQVCTPDGNDGREDDRGGQDEGGGGRDEGGGS